MSRSIVGMVLVAMLAMVGCRMTRDSQSQRPSPTPALQPTMLQYVDTDGFDALFEASLNNQDPVIVVKTDHEKPDWEGRLNAWIAAWNMGGTAERRIIRSQIPLPGQSLDAELVREFRLLVFGVVDRAEDLAKNGTAWWKEERTRARRVALLRKYNLRFHMSEENRIHLIFFNGDHAGHYADHVKGLDGSEDRSWSRTVECSVCSKLQEVSRLRPLPNVHE
jgi:hypothetical protein